MSGWRAEVSGTPGEERFRVVLGQEEFTVPELAALVSTLNEMLRAHAVATQEISR